MFMLLLPRLVILRLLRFVSGGPRNGRNWSLEPISTTILREEIVESCKEEYSHYKPSKNEREG